MVIIQPSLSLQSSLNPHVALAALAAAAPGRSRCGSARRRRGLHHHPKEGMVRPAQIMGAFMGVCIFVYIYIIYIYIYIIYIYIYIHIYIYTYNYAYHVRVITLVPWTSRQNSWGLRWFIPKTWDVFQILKSMAANIGFDHSPHLKALTKIDFMSLSTLVDDPNWFRCHRDFAKAQNRKSTLYWSYCLSYLSREMTTHLDTFRASRSSDTDIGICWWNS